jgi:phage terminase large subunit
LEQANRLEEAKARQEGDGELIAGVDVGGPGEDETCLCVRRGPKIVLLKAWTQDQPYGAVAAALMPFKKELKSINVDGVGIGVGMVNHLADLGFKVNSINVGTSPRDKTRFFNLKAEIYWQLRERARNGEFAGLTDEKAITQLVGIQYFHTPKGLVMIESKKDAAKRGVKSPDRAEAIILAFADIRMPGSGLIEWMKTQIQEQGMEDLAL